ncbi:DNA replication/repair protein RecF [Halopseudomonas salegens]|uniref:DNA replication and repair protein RecF n=1 Tax=Halopseudomonas salegens TaxID=1434072 RepID=A0A1H2HNB1_9GAMM|nr:DNA replication/repair protein RecF [Halopseudomonas salegens]SDU33334.1 DNA replication and repair protein RecF [Halopseudomonas salegens]
MPLTRLSVTGVRNLHPVTLHPAPRINLVYGANASGKTSLLEAIHLLGLARSFRTNKLQPVIQYAESQCTVFAELVSDQGETTQIGVQRSANSEFVIRINGQNVRSAAQLAETMPLQLINPDSFRLLEGAPKQRRQFLDWGVFHVEHGFLAAWQRLQKSLKQRNSLLRRGRIDSLLLAPWELELVQAANQIDAYRQSYIGRLKPVFEQVLADMLTIDGLTLSYFRGWDKEKPLADVLAQQFERDCQLGHTQAGPQRADLRVRVNNLNAVDVLSRGQQKLLVSALKIAQGYLLKQQYGPQSCVFLVDDLPSELDAHHRQALCRLLEQLDCQVFITCVEPEQLTGLWQSETPKKLFHVEHGHIAQTD